MPADTKTLLSRLVLVHPADFTECLWIFYLPSIIVFALSFPVFHFVLSEDNGFK